MYDIYDYSGIVIPEEKNLSNNKCPAKIDEVVYRIGTMDKYRVTHIDTYYNIITLINIRDKVDKIFSSYDNFDAQYKLIHF